MSILVNKLVTVMLETDRQYSYNIRKIDLETDNLIQVLSLQAMTQSKIRLTANNLMSYKETLTSLSQKTVSSDIFIISESTTYSSLNLSKKNTTILSLIKDIQEFNLQCRQIFNQLHEKSEENFSFALHENEILKKMNCVFVSHQETI